MTSARNNISVVNNSSDSAVAQLNVLPVQIDNVNLFTVQTLEVNERKRNLQTEAAIQNDVQNDPEKEIFQNYKRSKLSASSNESFATSQHVAAAAAAQTPLQNSYSSNNNADESVSSKDLMLTIQAQVAQVLNSNLSLKAANEEYRQQLALKEKQNENYRQLIQAKAEENEIVRQLLVLKDKQIEDLLSEVQSFKSADQSISPYTDPSIYTYKSGLSLEVGKDETSNNTSSLASPAPFNLQTNSQPIAPTRSYSDTLAAGNFGLFKEVNLPQPNQFGPSSSRELANKP